MQIDLGKQHVKFLLQQLCGILEKHSSLLQSNVWKPLPVNIGMNNWMFDIICRELNPKVTGVYVELALWSS